MDGRVIEGLGILFSSEAESLNLGKLLNEAGLADHGLITGPKHVVSGAACFIEHLSS